MPLKSFAWTSSVHEGRWVRALLRIRRETTLRKTTNLCLKPSVAVTGLILAVVFLVASSGQALAVPEGFKQYADPQGRFAFEYPATMRVQVVSQNEVKVLHPGATLRITVFVEERPHRSVPEAKVLLEAFKKKLQEEMKEPKVLEEGVLPGLQGSQGYVVCVFRDRRDLQLVQLVQYYVTEDRLLQMIISDRPEGFRNLQEVIRQIHSSLRITKPALK